MVRAVSRMRLVLAVTVLLALCISLSLAVAESRDTGWVEQSVARHVVDRLEGRLQMTAEQRGRASAVLERERPVMRKLLERTRREREELTAMRQFDEAATREILARYDADHTNVLVERTKIRMELRSLLTETQRARMDGIRRRFGAEFVDRVGELAEVI